MPHIYLILERIRIKCKYRYVTLLLEIFLILTVLRPSHLILACEDINPVASHIVPLRLKVALVCGYKHICLKDTLMKCQFS